MTNPALLVARLSGRPMLMLPSAAEAYARQLMLHAGVERPRGFLGWLGAGRRARTQAAETENLPAGPTAYYPMWLEDGAGQPDDEGFGWALKNNIALLEIDGPLCERGWAYDGETYVAGYDCLSQTVAEIAGDERVKGVFVKHDSPGGVAGPGLPALAAQLRALRAVKPVWSSADLSASADYWLASSTSRITAPGMGYVGSIGAVITLCEVSAALEKDGIKVEHIQFGSEKTDGSPFQALSPAARANFQADINELGALFVADVIAGRPGLTSEAVLATQAGCFLAKSSDPARSGLDLGLIDAVQSEQDTFAELAELVGKPLTTFYVQQPQQEAPMAETPSASGHAPAIARLSTRMTALSGASATALAAATASATAGDAVGEARSLARSANLNLRHAELEARHQRLEAQAPNAGDDAEDNDDDLDEDDGEEPPKPEAAPAAAAPPVAASSHAARIAASAAAEANPALALSAIKADLNLEQFEAMSAAAPAPAPRSALAAYMEANGGKRLAPDAQAPQGQSPAFTAAMADAKARSAAKR